MSGRKCEKRKDETETEAKTEANKDKAKCVVPSKWMQQHFLLLHTHTHTLSLSLDTIMAAELNQHQQKTEISETVCVSSSNSKESKRCSVSKQTHRLKFRKRQLKGKGADKWPVKKDDKKRHKFPFTYTVHLEFAHIRGGKPPVKDANSGQLPSSASTFPSLGRLIKWRPVCMCVCVNLCKCLLACLFAVCSPLFACLPALLPKLKKKNTSK